MVSLASKTAARAERFDVLDPARAKVIARMKEPSSAEIDRAVAAARRAFDEGSWRKLSALERSRRLMEVARRIRGAAEELALLESRNVGKPITQARGDIEGAAEFFEYYAHFAVDHPGEVIEYEESQMSLVVREPVGVVVAIIPWNYPITVAGAAVGAPLAAGNSVILKPSELTPLTAIRLAELVEDLFPAGVFTVLPGTGPGAGQQLSQHADVDLVMFTGSVRVGSEIMRTAAAEVKRVELELGGKSPTLIFADAPMERSVASALQRLALNQGENCAAGSRLLVEQKIYDDFMGRLIERAQGLVIGDPQQETTTLVPMISATHRDRVARYMESARKETRELYVGPTPQKAPFSKGFFLPISIWESSQRAKVWREEVFGPLLAVMPFRDEAEAIRLANDSDYGLMAVVWAGDRGRALRVAKSLRCGIVRVNGAGSPSHGPWGGFKKSGIGRNYGKYGIAAASELKQINIDLT